MQDEEGDMGLDPRSHKGSPSAAGNQAADPEPPTLPVPAPRPDLRGYRHCLVVLGAGCISLTLTVIVLSRVVSHLVSEKGQTPATPDCDGVGIRDPSTAEASAYLERFRSQLCPPAQPGPAEGSRCKLCPRDWQLRGDMCYWVSRIGETWCESCADCSARGSQLWVIRDLKELALTRGTSQFWVGLSLPSPEKAWTWLDGSRLDQTLFLVSGPAENSCGAVAGNQINSETCSSAFQWICQRDAVLL